VRPAPQSQRPAYHPQPNPRQPNGPGRRSPQPTPRHDSPKPLPKDHRPQSHERRQVPDLKRNTPVPTAERKRQETPSPIGKTSPPGSTPPKGKSQGSPYVGRRSSRRSIEGLHEESPHEDYAHRHADHTPLESTHRHHHWVHRDHWHHWWGAYDPWWYDDNPWDGYPLRRGVVASESGRASKQGEERLRAPDPRPRVRPRRVLSASPRARPGRDPSVAAALGTDEDLTCVDTSS
jgi:hypothetical protein